VPRHIRDIGLLRARPAGTSRPTAGRFNGEPIESGGLDRGIANDLDHDPLRGPPVTFYQHAESKAAARMRQANLREAELAIDNTVCGTNEHDRTYAWTCDKILPSILPPGAQLTVWVTRDGGQTWWRSTYVGTGERIRR